MRKIQFNDDGTWQEIDSEPVPTEPTPTLPTTFLDAQGSGLKFHVEEYQDAGEDFTRKRVVIEQVNLPLLIKANTPITIQTGSSIELISSSITLKSERDSKVVFNGESLKIIDREGNERTL